MDSLLLAKIATAIIAVVGLSLVAERVSPRVAGILSGYPLGTAIALFFIGIELGEPFAAASATAALSGFIASLLLICGYALGIRLGGERPLPLVALLGSGLGLLAFGLSGYLLSLLNLNLLGGSLALLLAIVLVGLVLAKIPDATVAKPVRLSPLVLLLRAAAAAMIVLLVTAAAKLLTPAQAGILAAFPITLYPFFVDHSSGLWCAAGANHYQALSQRPGVAHVLCDCGELALSAARHCLGNCAGVCGGDSVSVGVERLAPLENQAS